MSVANQPRSTPLGPLLAEPWAIAPSTLAQLLDHLSHRGDPREFFAQYARPQQPQPKAAVPGVVPITGFISERASIWDELFGGTSVESIREMFRAAMTDPAVNAIVLDVHSPGGTVAGITELATEIRNARGQGKRIVAVANTLAASAAYWLASQADEIVASPSASVGSIGIYAVHQEFSEYLEREGIKTTLISAGPHKTEGNEYEPLSDEARQHLQERADAFYASFVDDVAKGRGIPAATVKADYGGGRVLLAKAAAAAGMVDFIGTFEDALRKVVRTSTRASGPRAADTDTELVAEAREPFTERLALLAEDAEALASHGEVRAALRAKEGRAPLSDAHLAFLRSSRDAMDRLLALVDPAPVKPPAADPPQPAATPPAQPVAAFPVRSDQERTEFFRRFIS
jgi:signal peptide peptidase SppA